MSRHNFPAFPAIMEDQYGSKFANEGMTLRDYFAAKAMQGYAQYSAANSKFIFSDDDLAKASYAIADAMIKARNAAQ